MKNNNHILLVEDNPDDETLTIEALKTNNIINDIVVARDGQEALDYLFAEGNFSGRDIDYQPRVILLDLNLPKINGLEVLKRIRQHEITRRVPVVVLSTSSLESDIMKCYDLCANSYLCKPVNFDEFTHAIQQFGMYWLSLNKVLNA